MFTRKDLAAVGAGAALAGALVIGGLASPLASAFAAPTDGSAAVERAHQSTPASSPKPKPATKPGQGSQQAQQPYLDAVAANLGISPRQLQDAIKKARVDGVNRALAEGKISQEQANQAIQRIDSGQGQGGFGPGGRGKPSGAGQPGGAGGGGFNARDAMRGGMQAAAQAVGLTPEQLREQVKAGKSLAKVAEERNVSRDDLKARLTAATRQQLDLAVQQGRMTAEQSGQVFARFSAHLDRMIDFAPGQKPKRQTPAA